MKTLVLGYPRGWNKWKCIVKALENIGHEVDTVIENYDDIEGPYDRIYTVAESLLPIQAKLEKQWGIKNVSETAADILSNKKKFDDMCISLGLESLIPFSVIPTQPKDLDIFKDIPFIIKPVIGSGSKPGGMNYISFKNKNEFLLSVAETDLQFFKNNKRGKEDPEFNNRINFYMAQEQLMSMRMWNPYYYVNNTGDIKELAWLKTTNTYNQIDQYKFQTRNNELISVSKDEVPIEVREKAHIFFDKIINNLKLRNMIFSGPDFYKVEDKIKMIDCNPRLGQGLQQLDDVHNNEILPKILKDEPFSFDKKILWKMANLKPGKIKSVKDTSHLKKYLVKTNNDKLKPNETIAKYVHINQEHKAPKVGFLITGTNESDMQKTYQIVNDQLQECISYY
tara:strand:- start:851 stop:2035 length:1185 start_codon:yes stop_codon:yes gene_type:complete